jgi:PIN domain nuclease of toxin-antitoxin system
VARLKLLLDTHIWLWSQLAPEKLGPRVQKVLLDTSNEQWLSPISVWELALLNRKRRITIPGDFSEWCNSALAGFFEAPFTHGIALAAEQILLHGDPADRFLAATAKVLGLTLVTADQRLLGLGEIATLANR